MICGRPFPPLRVKNAVEFYWQDPLGSYGNLKDLLMIINIQEDPLGFLQDSCKIFTRFLYDLETVINFHDEK